MSNPPFDVNAFARRVGAWLQDTGPESDVVISSRVRLARNFGSYPFPSRLDEGRAAEIAGQVRAVLLDARLDGETWWLALDELDPIVRLLLLERNLASRDLIASTPDGRGLRSRAVAFGQAETVSVMVNEEDHLRLQALAPGYDLELAWQRSQVLDRYLEDRLEFAYSNELGYLTCCPTNVGTGLRASVMLHLPALGMVRRELERVFTAAQHTGLAVRGMHGEGSRAAGDLYQVSNQVTLGRSEEQLIGQLHQVVPGIVDFERSMRRTLHAKREGALRDRVAKSYGHLRTARSLATDAALAHLSNVRLGIQEGLLSGPRAVDLGRLGIQVQRGHIHAIMAVDSDEGVLEASERDRLRASFLRENLAH